LVFAIEQQKAAGHLLAMTQLIRFSQVSLHRAFSCRVCILEMELPRSLLSATLNRVKSFPQPMTAHGAEMYRSREIRDRDWGSHGKCAARQPSQGLPRGTGFGEHFA